MTILPTYISNIYIYLEPETLTLKDDRDKKQLFESDRSRIQVYIYIYTVYYRWYILLNWFLSGDPTGMRIKPACLWVPRFEPYIATGLNIYI